MKLLFVNHTAIESGGEIALVRLVSALGDHDVHVVLAEDGPIVHRLRATGVSVTVLALSRRSRTVKRSGVRSFGAVFGAVEMAVYSVRLASVIRGLGPDVVHANSLKSGLYGCFAARLARRPAVWHVRDRLSPDYIPAPAARLLSICLRHLPDLILVNSQSTEATVQAVMGTARRRAERLVVLPDAYETPSELHRNEPDAFTVGMVGRLSPWKGQDVFIKAFAQAFADGDERARIIGGALFGEHEWHDGLEQLIIELGMSERIVLEGHREDIDQQFATLHVLVHASTIPEPFGQVVLEGMAHGCAVIASNAGGPAEMITNGVDGLLVSPGDVAELADALRLLRDDSALRAAIATAGQRRARDFTPALLATRLVDEYNALLADRRQ